MWCTRGRRCFKVYWEGKLFQKSLTVVLRGKNISNSFLHKMLLMLL